MKTSIYVAIDAKTGEFFTPKTYSRFGRKRKVQAYISEAVAIAALNQFHPKPDQSEYIIKRYVPAVATRDIMDEEYPG